MISYTLVLSSLDVEKTPLLVLSISRADQREAAKFVFDKIEFVKLRYCSGKASCQRVPGPFAAAALG